MFFRDMSNTRRTLPVLPLRATVIFPGVTVPIAAGRPRTLRAIESAKSRDEFRHAIRSPEMRDVAIEMIAADNGIPRFLAARVYTLLVGRLAKP